MVGGRQERAATNQVQGTTAAQLRTNWGQTPLDCFATWGKVDACWRTVSTRGLTPARGYDLGLRLADRGLTPA